MESRRYIPIKYKFLAVLFVITVMSLSIFFAFTYKTFSEDKKLFVMDLNISVLRATTSDIKLELKSRIEELQIFVPRVYQKGTGGGARAPNERESEDPFQGLSPSLPDELLSVTFYRQKGDSFESFKSFEHKPLFVKKGLPDDFVATINAKRPLNLKEQVESQDMGMVNRSVSLSHNGKTHEVPVITFLVSGNYVDSDSKGVVIAIDLIQDFLRKKLQQSEIAEIFLLRKNGMLLSHPAVHPTVEFAGVQFPHPITARIAGKQFPRESMELDIKGESYLCNVSETGFKDIFAVSQIRKSEAFLSLQTLIHKSIYLSIFVLAVALVLSILFASGLTANIQKLQQAAELIGAGNLKVDIKVNSRDEIGLVSESFQWMAGRIQELVTETAQKARMAEELATAKLVQDTLLTTPSFQSQSFQIDSFYTAAGECGGDLWDAFIKGNKLTIIVGDATGHGAPAAIVVAVAKACFATLNGVFRNQNLPPEQVLEMANHVIHHACQGQLLMTMSLVQLDLETGQVVHCSAGHEPVFCMRKSLKVSTGSAEKKTKMSAEILFAQGERLGFAKSAKYTAEEFHMQPGDTLMIYTDGLSEARDPEMKEWGERALRKAFVRNGFTDLATIKKHVLESMTEHIRNEPYHDDVTFVLLRWLKRTEGENSTIDDIPNILGLDSFRAAGDASTHKADTVAAPAADLTPETDDEFGLAGQNDLAEISIDPLLDPFVDITESVPTPAEELAQVEIVEELAPVDAEPPPPEEAPAIDPYVESLDESTTTTEDDPYGDGGDPTKKRAA
ncbi:MAG: SpoIIE family protein phosphatase [Deltaproteobacteria bacterium]|nr:SpoIIE family protein phosphatase [Deltaproteobacteria bacterium]